MCGISTAKLGDTKYEIGVGYFGGDFSIDGRYYNSEKPQDMVILKEDLVSLSKSELVDMIVQFV